MMEKSAINLQWRLFALQRSQGLGVVKGFSRMRLRRQFLEREERAMKNQKEEYPG
jgi:hypothetical protein